MPRHDYHCQQDGTLLRDQYRPVHEGASAHPPLCPTCRLPMEVIPQANFDLRSDGTAFAKFTAYDGRNQPVEIDSLHKLRQVERESEQLARNGEGQHMTFRAYANNASNLDQNTHGEHHAERPSLAGKRKFGLQGGAKPLLPDLTSESGEPDRPYGPGVSDSNASALPLSSSKD